MSWLEEAINENSGNHSLLFEIHFFFSLFSRHPHFYYYLATKVITEYQSFESMVREGVTTQAKDMQALKQELAKVKGEMA